MAIPLSLQDLADDLRRADKEFARIVALDHFKAASAEDAWNRGYRTFVEDVTEVISDVRSLGVTTVENAHLCELPRLFAKYSVVSVLAHGPFLRLKMSDVLAAEKVMQAIRRDSSDSDRHAVIELLSRSEEVREAQSPAQLVKALRLLIARTKDYYRSGDPVAMEPEAGLTSLLLYEAFPDCFKPPAIVELRDGFQDFDSFCSVIPEGFSGNLEFLVCSALWFGEALRRRRPQCGDILSPRQLAFARARISLYRVVIRLLASQPMGYTDAVLTVHHAARDLGDDGDIRIGEDE